MITRWGRDLDRSAVLDDYPRPQMRRTHWINLNGTWQYAITPKTAAEPRDWDGEILVPFCVESPLSGVARSVGPAERLWYRRSFTLETSSKRTLLHFGAVDYDCVVWINGGIAGTHTGGFDPFTIDIAEFAQTGNNTIVVAVTDPTSSSDQPRGKQHLKPQNIWYTAVTGIWQTVWLEQVPANMHIEELHIVPAPSCDAIEFTAFLNRPSRDPRLAVEIKIYLDDTLITTAVARADRTITIPISEPILWSPDNPTLYDIEVALIEIKSPLPQDNDRQLSTQLQRDIPLRGAIEAQLYAEADLAEKKVIDSVEGYFGLRRIELGAHPQKGHPALLLNGEPIFHLGPLDQGWWPDGLHTPPADEAMIYEIEYLKAAGFNTLRKHIKVEPARYYYHCDRLGILVWQDMPSAFLPAQFVAPNDADEGLRSNRSTEQYELELHRLINRLKPFPSIVVWVLHNEGWGQFDTARLTQRIRDLDPARLINATSGWLDCDIGDLIDCHDYGEDPSPPTADGKRALVVGEYGGIGWPIHGHLWNPAMRNWGYQTLHNLDDVSIAYRKVTQAIIDAYDTQGLCGAIYTQTTDVEGEINGLLTYDREIEKLPREWLAQVHAPLTQRQINDEPKA